MSNMATETNSAETVRLQIVRPANPDSKVYTAEEAYLLRDNMRAFLLANLSDLGAKKSSLNSQAIVEVIDPETNAHCTIEMKPMGGDGGHWRSSTSYSGVNVNPARGNCFVVTPKNIDGAEAKLVQAAQDLREALKLQIEQHKIQVAAVLKNSVLMGTLPFKPADPAASIYERMVEAPSCGSNYVTGYLRNGRKVIIRPYTSGAYGVEVTSLVAKSEEEMRKIIAFIESLSEAK